MDDQKTDALQTVGSMLPVIDFEVVNTFYDQVQEIVENLFIRGYHYGPPYEIKPNKPIPPDILYKKGAQLFVDRVGLFFEDSFDFMQEANKHFSFICKAKMYKISNPILLASGEGSCGSDEGRFSYMAIEKVSQRQVRDQAKTRAHKECIERFFNPSRFFPGIKIVNNITTDKKEDISKPEQKKPEPVKKVEPIKKDIKDRKSLKFDWEYEPEDLNSKEWYYDQLRSCRDQQEITDFMQEFKRDLSCLYDPIQEEIRKFAGEKFHSFDEKGQS